MTRNSQIIVIWLLSVFAAVAMAMAMAMEMAQEAAAEGVTKDRTVLAATSATLLLSKY
jgi:hypothetical protein